ncbi:hypothetical protein [Cohnella xylanilytica]|uniref:hypothetical protein n=1 Tax=Cohnella xylanilytica TaxID=557555 RepID=UPI001BB40FB0|nr:hypothetical protein [Cohnella xylanilytica]
MPGKLAHETDRSIFTPQQFPRVLTEQAADAVAARGVCISVVRLSPTVHGEGDHGFIPLLINIAREKGVSAYMGEGNHRWSAVHRLDSARLYRLALSNKVPGARFHAVAEPSILFRQIAVAIGHGLGIPAVLSPLMKHPRISVGSGTLPNSMLRSRLNERESNSAGIHRSRLCSMIFSMQVTFGDRSKKEAPDWIGGLFFMPLFIWAFACNTCREGSNGYPIGRNFPPPILVECNRDPIFAEKR